jgi:chromosome segregation ATPase
MSTAQVNATRINAQRIADGPASIAAAAAVPADLDARIEAAFSDGAASATEVAALIREIEAVAPRLDVASEEAFAVVSSEVRSIQEIREARRLIEDISVRRRHLQTATADLRARHRELMAEAEDQQRRVRYARAEKERDRVAAELAAIYDEMVPELAKFYPRIERKLRELKPRLEASDREVRYVNARLPSDVRGLREADLVAGELSGFFQSGEGVPSITEQLDLPVHLPRAR